MSVIMADLESLFESSRDADVLTIEATVDTGFETFAAKECREKFGSTVQVCHSRGRIYINVPSSQYYLVQSLRSVNNLHLVAGVIKDVSLKPAEENDQEFDLQSIEKLPDVIQWRKYLDAWKRISKFEGIVYPTYEQYLEAVAVVAAMNTAKVLPFRVTCYRSGKHSFGSQDAARSFGGRLQDMFHWLVDLDGYELEIILDVTNTEAIVLIALTESSMHRRNISHFGITTLRSTVSYNLLQVAEPKVGEVVMDPLCGSGSIPIEGAVGMPGTYHLCGDIEEKQVKLTRMNKQAYYENHKLNLLMDSFHWNVCALPVRDSCIDVIATDLPFGKRVGSKANNRTLYSNAMRELARVAKPSTGRMVLLTTDRTAYNLGLQKNKEYWKQMKMLGIKLGGLKAFVFLLVRTCSSFKY